MIGVILAGGAGTRLWPVSRAYWPKFLLTFPSSEKGRKKISPTYPLLSPSDKTLTLIQETFLRLTHLTQPSKIIAVVNEEHKFFVKENLTAVNEKFPAQTNIIAEPVSRNTLAAISVAALKSWHDFGDEPMLVCPSDHVIKDITNFRQSVETALSVCNKENKIVIFGIKPTRPETGYGYICPGEVIQSVKNVYAVKAFYEKPSHEKAKSFFLSKKWLWNAGIFLIKPSVLFEEIERYQPDFYKLLKPFIKNQTDFNYSELIRIYPEFQSVSIDYAVIEKSKKVVVVPLDVVWDDVGDWGALNRLYNTDKNGNILMGDVVPYDTFNTSVVARPVSEGGRLIGVAGLKNTIIVDTPDALLITTMNSAQNVRELVRTLPLKSSSYKEATLRHKIVPRPWGEYDVIASYPGYKVKIIKVLPHKKLSLQKHLLRSEKWTVLKGEVNVIKGSAHVVLKENESIEIPRGVVHRLENKKNTEAHILEISRGRHITEDDIIRIEDDFERGKKNK